LLEHGVKINEMPQGSILHPEVGLMQQVTASHAWGAASRSNNQVVDSCSVPWVVKRVSRIAETARTGKGPYTSPCPVLLIEQRDDIKRVIRIFAES